MTICPISITGMGMRMIEMVLFQEKREITMNREGTMNQTHQSSESMHQRVFFFVLMGLLILRIPFVAGISFFDIQWVWTSPIYQIGTYLLTAFLIWWETDDLAEYHIDPLALMIIILFKPIQTLILKYWGIEEDPLTFPNIPSLIIWVIAIVFTIGVWLKRSKLPSIKPVSIGWLIVGIPVGLAISIVLSFPESFQMSLVDGLSVKEILGQIPLLFFQQTGYAAVLEEPLFRGFLWGYLHKLKWHEVWIWLFQAGLFSFSHIYYLNRYPISFWIGMPVSALVLGWLVWRSRTIASSMMAHGMMNATGYAFDYLMMLYRLG